ncbi:MAG TPA: alcohol dehydrogenase catalytic domain-containing protein, partial [bacterium]|nr:alcohol dehydrogenase catalytic domain-containing protein [bacterium]
MKAIWLEAKAVTLRDDLAEPDGAGEAVVRVTQAGVCATDLELVRGYYPYTGILGHEFVGVVEQGPDHLVGRRVVGEINAVCGECAACRAGRRNHCERRTVLGIVNRPGAFAERLSLPAENLHVVPDSVPDEVAVFVEPLAAALRVTEQLDPGEGDRVLVLGDGRLGQLVARVLALSGYDIEAVGR